jgi:hypothetical protein
MWECLVESGRAWEARAGDDSGVHQQLTAGKPGTGNSGDAKGATEATSLQLLVSARATESLQRELTRGAAMGLRCERRKEWTRGS